MNALPERVSGSIRLLRETHASLKSACTRKGITIQDALDEAVEQWLTIGIPERPSTAIPEKSRETLHMGDGADINLSVIWNRAQAADPLLTAKLIEALQLVGNISARPDSLATRPSGVDALAAAKAATEALDRETRAAEEIVARAEKGHGGSIEAAPGPRRLKNK